MKKIGLIWLTVTVAALSGCAVTIRPVDFSWSYESVLTAGPDGVAKGQPKTIAFDAGPLFEAETGVKGAAAGKVVRIIRDRAGYYFITAPGFRHVYVFSAREGRLSLKKKVRIAKEGMEQPFFNLREGGVELGANGKLYLLTKKGIVSGGAK